MNQSERLNGNYDLLARAMRTVVSEAVQEGIKPVREDMRDMAAQFAQHREEVTTQLAQHREEVDTALRTTNENVQAQLAEHRKDVAALLAENRKDVAHDVRRELAAR